MILHWFWFLDGLASVGFGFVSRFFCSLGTLIIHSPSSPAAHACRVLGSWLSLFDDAPFTLWILGLSVTLDGLFRLDLALSLSVRWLASWEEGCF
ncbi:hypothetical protein QBC34DRAFT_404412 [Podospora aff. communis PSN243]|uniref:Secreted protein n=1 Tax=Podospora aff. communis PSN243 TaxID=3040156 RepID=A0AAV9GN09_9PEZI|nr:hypothetical protein QBC34DRAFT_404412 [Podospora aff. communis PSN243]